LNIAIVFHGFRVGAKAMGKTARGCGSHSCCESKQHPAILPWPSGLSRDIDGPFARLKSAELKVCRAIAEASLRSADTRAEKPARKL
jgi:hypothetical protein